MTRHESGNKDAAPSAATDVKAVQRNSAWDALRGLFLVVMTIDHFPSGLQNVTKEMLGWVSAAEGFVFLSGLVAGLVYAGYQFKPNVPSLWKRAIARAGVIYAHHMTLFLLLFAAIFFLRINAKTWEIFAPLMYENPKLALGLGLALIYQPTYMDILPMYCLFILTVPFLVGLQNEKHRLLCLGISGLLWLSTQFGTAQVIEDFFLRDFSGYSGEAFCIQAWQFLFVLGVFIGSRRRDSFSIPRHWVKLVVTICIIIVVALFVINHRLMEGARVSDFERWAGKLTLGPIRLLNFLVIAFLVSQIPKWPEKNWFFLRLACLGRHSLQVFTFHVLSIYLFYDLVMTWPFWNKTGKELPVLLIVVSLYLPAWLCERWKQRRRRLQSAPPGDRPSQSASSIGPLVGRE